MMTFIPFTVPFHPRPYLNFANDGRLSTTNDAVMCAHRPRMHRVLGLRRPKSRPSKGEHRRIASALGHPAVRQHLTA